MRQRLPDAQAELPLRVELLPEPRDRRQPAVLVVDGGDAARGGEPQARAHRLQVLVVRRLDVALLEPPRRLLARARRSARRAASSSTTPPGTCRSPFAARQRRGVEPERVVVLREERRRHVAGDGVERLLRRLLGPVGARASPARAASGPAGTPAEALAHRRAPRRATPRPRAGPAAGRRAQLGKWTCESVKPGQHAAAAEVDHLRAWRGPSRAVPTPPATRSPAIASARPSGSDGSIVRIAPFSRITRLRLYASLTSRPAPHDFATVVEPAVADRQAEVVRRRVLRRGRPLAIRDRDGLRPPGIDRRSVAGRLSQAP